MVPKRRTRHWTLRKTSETADGDRTGRARCDTNKKLGRAVYKVENDRRMRDASHAGLT